MAAVHYPAQSSHPGAEAAAASSSSSAASGALPSSSTTLPSPSSSSPPKSRPVSTDYASTSAKAPSDILTPPTSHASLQTSEPTGMKNTRGADDDDDEENLARGPRPRLSHHRSTAAEEDSQEDDEDQDETMREKSPTPQAADKVRNKRTSSGSYRQVLPDRKKPAASASTSATPSLMLMAIDATGQQRTTPPVSSSRTTIDEEPEEPSSQPAHTHSERASVLHDSARKQKRTHRRRPSTSSISSQDDPERSRTPSPILGDAYPYAGAASRPGHLGPPTPGPSAADIQSLLYDGHDGRSGAASEDVDGLRRPSTLPDSSEINAMIAKVEEMGFKEGATAIETSSTGESTGPGQSQSREAELANMVHKLGQHALDQDAYIRSMEETLHNTRVTAVSVISSLTASHAYEIASERQLRDRLEVELEGAQASARMLSSLLSKAQNRNSEFDRDRAASVEEEMRWAATLPPSARKVSGGSTVKGVSPRHPQAGSPTPGSRDAAPADQTPAHSSTAPPHAQHNVIGLGMSGTPSLPQPEYTDIFDSPMSTVISERNKLAADKKYLRTRVRDAEAQLHRLENELKALRPLLVHGGARALMATSGPSVPNTPMHHSTQQTPSRSRRDRSQRRRKMITMGDAEAEHLLLAARRLNHARSMGSLPTFSEHSSPFKSSTAPFNPSDRPRTPPPAAQRLPPRTPGTGGTAFARTPRSAGGRARDGPHASGSGTGGGLMDSLLINGTPGASNGSPQAKSRALFGHHARLESNASNASFNGMDELLHAAQSVLTPRDRVMNSKASEPNLGAAASGPGGAYFPPVKGPTQGSSGGIFDHHHLANDSPKRRRVSVTALDSDRPRIFSASPQARHLPGLAKAFPPAGAGRHLRTRTEGADLSSGPSPRAPYQGLRGQSSARGAGDEIGSAGPLSALDLLADQAAASQNPSQSSEPSVSDGEKRDGFSSQEEGPGYGPDSGAAHRRSSASYPSHATPRKTAASSLMAARARVSAAPLAYAHSIAPAPDYSQTRYPYHGHGGSAAPGHPSPHPPATMSSPIAPPHHLQSLPPMADAYAPRGVGSSGHLGPGPVPPGYMTNLPPINTALPHHHHPPGPHTHAGHGHPMHGQPLPLGPMSAGPGAHHGSPISHGHHHSLPGMSALTNGYPVGSAGPPGSSSSPLSSPITGGYPTPRHHKSSASLDGSSVPSVLHGSGAMMHGGLPPPQPAFAPSSNGGGGGGGSSSSSSSKAPKPKGGNTSPDKRLPYVRWTSEEDTKLKNAIAHYGQRWEAVAKAVGTRSYHQCRQRALLMRRKGLDPGNGVDRGKSQDGENGTASAESGASAVEEGDEGDAGDEESGV